MRPVSLAQGQFAVSDDPDVVMTTVLGSCVAACLRDPVREIGGMNHFVLPEAPASRLKHPDSSRYGSVLMSLLLDDLLHQGARLSRLEAVVLGGAGSRQSIYNIGERNLAYARNFLSDHGVTVRKTSPSGLGGCRLEYWPVSGKLIQTPVGQ